MKKLQGAVLDQQHPVLIGGGRAQGGGFLGSGCMHMLTGLESGALAPLSFQCLEILEV